MNTKDRWTWIVIAIVIVAAIAAIYLETRPNTSAIDVSLKAQVNGPQNIYPFQSVIFPITLTNYGGSAFRDLGVGVFINGNLTEAYNVTLPQHNSTTINFTEEFKYPGTFKVSFTADPSGLFPIENRSAATSAVTIVVQQEQAPAPASNLPQGQATEKDSYMNSAGYLTESYLRDTYNISAFGFSGMPSVDGFFEPLLNLTYNYTHSIYTARATYPNASAFSIWIQGALIGNITAVWAKGLESMNKNISYTFNDIGGRNLTVVTLGRGTTICSWYSGGWIKSLAYEGQKGCDAVLNDTGSSIATQKFSIPIISNSSLLANLTTSTDSGSQSGVLSYVSNSIVYISEQDGAPGSACFGLVYNISNVSYCSTYTTSGRDVLVRTTRGSFLGNATTSSRGYRNLTVLALVNASLLPYQTQENVALLQSFNAIGSGTEFVSGISSTCSFNTSLSCYSPALALGNLTMRFYNKLNETVNVSSMYCSESGAGKYYAVNAVIPASSNYTVKIPCYDNGALITGVPLGLTLNLRMNYVVSGKNYMAVGSAYVV